jgi:hypothetical protein
VSVCSKAMFSSRPSDRVGGCRMIGAGRFALANDPCHDGPENRHQENISRG